MLEVRGLRVRYRTPTGEVTAVAGVDFDIHPGEGVGLLGESGCGKTSLSLAVAGLLPASAVTSGGVHWRGRRLDTLPAAARRRFRGAEVGLVFQHPDRSLDPLQRVGGQIAQILRAHHRARGRQAQQQARQMLAEVGFADPAATARAYPHQLSGGQRQRVAIAQALVCRPALVIADEPTAGLDSVSRAHLLRLLLRLRQERRTALLVISHDPLVLAATSDRLLVMQEGRLIERGAASEVLHHPRQPQTRRLLSGLSGPRSSAREQRSITTERSRSPLLEALALTKIHPSRGRSERPAVDAVNLRLAAGDTLALVGRTGSGKTSLARCLALLDRPSAGQILLDGEEFHRLQRAARARIHHQVQLVPQHPASALNPLWRAAQAVAEPLFIHRRGNHQQRHHQALEWMAEVGLGAELAQRPVGRLSGGQRQRLVLARALAARPRLLILDEALSALDLPRRAQLAQLLDELRRKHHLALLWISHDLHTVSRLTERIAVLDQGRIVEQGTCREVLSAPAHPATQALIDALLEPPG